MELNTQSEIYNPNSEHLPYYREKFPENLSNLPYSTKPLIEQNFKYNNMQSDINSDVNIVSTISSNSTEHTNCGNQISGLWKCLESRNSTNVHSTTKLESIFDHSSSDKIYKVGNKADSFCNILDLDSQILIKEPGREIYVSAANSSTADADQENSINSSSNQQNYRKNIIGWKSNKIQRPKTYNCPACNKWFTSSGHLKRHYNTNLHKVAMRSCIYPDPASLPAKAHYFPTESITQTKQSHSYNSESHMPYYNNSPPFSPTTQLTSELYNKRSESLTLNIEYSVTNGNGYKNLYNTLYHTTPSTSGGYSNYFDYKFEDNAEIISSLSNGDIHSGCSTPINNRKFDMTTIEITPPFTPDQNNQIFGTSSEQNLYMTTPPSTSFQLLKQTSPLPPYSPSISSSTAHELLGNEIVSTTLNKSIFPSAGYMNANHLILSSSQVIKSQDSLYQCVECKKSFKKPCYLTQHNKTFHSGDRPYKCGQCGKRFTSGEDYQHHSIKHGNDKPFKCDKCPKQFNYRSDLRRHMCLHSGCKPFSCIQCGKGFIRRDHMQKHMESHRLKLIGLARKTRKLN